MNDMLDKLFDSQYKEKQKLRDQLDHMTERFCNDILPRQLFINTTLTRTTRAGRS